MEGPQLADPTLLALLDDVQVRVPRGEPRRHLALAADALVAGAPPEEIEAALAGAAKLLWEDDALADARSALHAAADGTRPPEVAALTLAYRAALALLARDRRVQAPLQAVEETFASLDPDDRRRLAPVIARAATPALALDLELLRDEGYRYVATYPPEGSEGVDVVGRAASWLTRRLTVDGDGPRIVMRRFLTLLADEIELDLPATAAALDGLLAAPMPAAPAQDEMFLALARGIVEDAVARRGFPF